MLPLSLREVCDVRPFVENTDPSLEIVMALFPIGVVDLATWQCVFKQLAVFVEVAQPHELDAFLYIQIQTRAMPRSGSSLGLNIF